MDIFILLLLFVGLVCFIIAAVDRWAPSRVNLIALGLACWIATVLLPHLK